MYVWPSLSRAWINRLRLPILLRGQLNRKMNISLSLYGSLVGSLSLVDVVRTMILYVVLTFSEDSSSNITGTTDCKRLKG